MVSGAGADGADEKPEESRGEEKGKGWATPAVAAKMSGRAGSVKVPARGGPIRRSVPGWGREKGLIYKLWKGTTGKKKLGRRNTIVE